MKFPTVLLVAPLLAAPAALSASGTPSPGRAAPAAVPYLCDGGGTAWIVYRGGGDYLHAAALVSFEGRNVEMRAAPALSGIRYRAETGAGGGVPLAWSLRGEQARLTESPAADAPAEGEREIARCVRLRGGAAPGQAVRTGH